MTPIQVLAGVTSPGPSSIINLGGIYDEFTLQFENAAISSLTAASTTAGQNNITVASTASVAVGEIVVGTGIPANTTISMINSGTSLTLSNPATATNAGLTLTVFGAITAIALNLEGSLTGTDTDNGGGWYTLGTITRNVDGWMTWSWQKPMQYIRANLLTLQGVNPSISAYLAYGISGGGASASTAATAATTPDTIPALTVANVKASPGNVYGVAVQNPNASVVWIQFYNTAGVPTLGTGVMFSIPVAANFTGMLNIGNLALANFTTGIGIGAATTATGAVAPASAPAVTAFFA